VVPFVVKRVLTAVPTLLIVTLMVFAIQRALPGDPARILAGEQQDPEVIAYIRAKYHLDDPVPVQYVAWLAQVVRGDLGTSIRTNQSVLALIASKLPVTVELALLSMLVAVVIAIPAGVVSATKKGTVFDYGGTVAALSGLSIPNFWLGIMLILLISVQLKWLPASGYVPLGEGVGENLKRMIMPAFVLGTGLAAVLMRQMRSAMLDVMRQDFVRTARAKGQRPSLVIVRHAMRNALIPVTTLLGLQLGALLSGAVLTEQVFTLPGFGKLVVDAIYNRDYAVVQGVVMVTATAYIVINLLVDIAYAVIDPRISAR